MGSEFTIHNIIFLVLSKRGDHSRLQSSQLSGPPPPNHEKQLMCCWIFLKSLFRWLYVERICVNLHRFSMFMALKNLGLSKNTHQHAQNKHIRTIKHKTNAFNTLQAWGSPEAPVQPAEWASAPKPWKTWGVWKFVVVFYDVDLFLFKFLVFSNVSTPSLRNYRKTKQSNQNPKKEIKETSGTSKQTNKQCLCTFKAWEKTEAPLQPAELVSAPKPWKTYDLKFLMFSCVCCLLLTGHDWFYIVLFRCLCPKPETTIENPTNPIKPHKTTNNIRKLRKQKNALVTSRGSSPTTQNSGLGPFKISNCSWEGPQVLQHLLVQSWPLARQIQRARCSRAVSKAAAAAKTAKATPKAEGHSRSL